MCFTYLCLYWFAIYCYAIGGRFFRPYWLELRCGQIYTPDEISRWTAYRKLEWVEYKNIIPNHNLKPPILST